MSLVTRKETKIAQGYNDNPLPNGNANTLITITNCAHKYERAHFLYICTARNVCETIALTNAILMPPTRSNLAAPRGASCRRGKLMAL